MERGNHIKIKRKEDLCMEQVKAKVKAGMTLAELLEAYEKKQYISIIPEALREERLVLYGKEFIDLIQKDKERVDEAVSAFLGSRDFFYDLEEAEKQWKQNATERVYGCWLELEGTLRKKKKIALYLTVESEL